MIGGRQKVLNRSVIPKPVEKVDRWFKATTMAAVLAAISSMCLAWLGSVQILEAKKTEERMLDQVRLDKFVEMCAAIDVAVLELSWKIEESGAIGSGDRGVPDTSVVLKNGKIISWKIPNADELDSKLRTSQDQIDLVLAKAKLILPEVLTSELEELQTIVHDLTNGSRWRLYFDPAEKEVDISAREDEIKRLDARFEQSSKSLFESCRGLIFSQGSVIK